MLAKFKKYSRKQYTKMLLLFSQEIYASVVFGHACLISRMSPIPGYTGQMAKSDTVSKSHIPTLYL
jgi:hypothetical protein